MTEEQLQQIQKRLEAATPGPWTKSLWRGWITGPSGRSVVSMLNVDVTNLELIAHAPEDIRALLAEVRRLQERVKELDRFNKPPVPPRRVPIPRRVIGEDE